VVRACLRLERLDLEDLECRCDGESTDLLDLEPTDWWRRLEGERLRRASMEWCVRGVVRGEVVAETDVEVVGCRLG